MARRFHRIRHHASSARVGWKGSLMSVGAGAATGIASAYAVSAVPMLSSAWWTMPAAMAAVGHFLKRKYPAAGGALLGIAGYWGYTAFQNNRGAAPAATAKGYDDAGALSYNDTQGTSAMPALETAQAAALVDPTRQARGYVDAGAYEAYGLES